MAKGLGVWKLSRRRLMGWMKVMDWAWSISRGGTEFLLVGMVALPYLLSPTIGVWRRAAA